MFSSNRLAVIALSVAVLAGAAACSESTSAGMGTVGVRLTNESVAAFVASDIVGAEAESPLGADAVKSVDIFVVRIDAKREEPSDDDAAAATEESESEKDGWVT